MLVVTVPFFSLEGEYIYIILIILHMILIQPESILQTWFCNKIELGHFDLVILLPEYFYPVQLWGVFTSYYKQKARFFFKKEQKNWIKNRHLETSKRITISFAKHNCTNSNCLCQLLKQEATKNIYINSSGCLYQRGNQKLQLTQRLSIYLPLSIYQEMHLPSP